MNIGKTQSLLAPSFNTGINIVSQGVLRSGKTIKHCSDSTHITTAIKFLLKSPLNFLELCHEMAQIENMKEVCRKDVKPIKHPKKTVEEEEEQKKKSKVERICSAIAKMLKELIEDLEEMMARMLGRDKALAEDSKQYHISRDNFRRQSNKQLDSFSNKGIKHV